MIENGLFETVGLARDRLRSLRTRLGESGVAPGSVEVDWTLRELEEMLDKLQARATNLHEILERTSDIFFAKDPDGRYVMTNSKGASLRGKPATGIVGEGDTALFERENPERMRALAAEIVIAEECLRESLVTDLHDGLGQDIALAKIKLAALRCDSAEALREPLLQIEHLVDQADHSLRGIAYQLSPPSLHDLGLLPALEWLAEDISARYGFEVRVEELGSPAPLDERMRMILFRAVRELVLNTATHARARLVRVQLAAADGSLCVRVEDDGSGFDHTRADLEGYGLFGIREQLEHVGGSLEIHSQPGRGTTVTLRAPYTFAPPLAA